MLALTNIASVWYNMSFFTVVFQNITDVVAAIADLIRVKIPSSYEVSSGPGGTMGAIKTSVDPQRLTSALHEPNRLRATLQAPQQLQHNHNKSEEHLLIHILSQFFLVSGQIYVFVFDQTVILWSIITIWDVYFLFKLVLSND